MKKITRRSFVKKSSLLSASMAAGLPMVFSKKTQAQSKKPNIIYIMADDLGYGNLGCYGQKDILTPNLDKMAQEGMRFTDCYSGSTVCAPSRCCLMTGYHTGHARIRGNKRHPLLPQDVTVAEVLKKAGYTNGIVGKWGLAEPNTTGIPNKKGFDFWYGYLNQHRAHNYFPDYLWRNEERDFFKRWTYSHDAMTDESHKFIRRNKDNPFFLYLAYTIPHAFNEGGENGMSIQNDDPYGNKPWPQQDRNFAAMVTKLDKDVGRLFDLLQELNIDDNTIVFFTSDNGPHREGGHDPYLLDDNGPLRGIKRDLYEGGIRVPMIARWPGKIQANSVNDHPWAFWDFLPTAAEIAGEDAPANIDGISVLPTLLGKPQQKHDYLYWEFYERGFHQAVRMGNWKGVRLHNKPLELYNLENDLHEANNIVANHPEIAEKITSIMKTAHIESEHYPVN